MPAAHYGLMPHDGSSGFRSLGAPLLRIQFLQGFVS